jgi:hypothetical protein
MPNRLLSKTAIITGSSSGIGRETALAYAREGANVIVSDLHEKPPNQSTQQTTTVEEVLKIGTKAFFVKCDVTKEEEVEALIKRAVEEFGRLDMYDSSFFSTMTTTCPCYRQNPHFGKNGHTRSVKREREKTNKRHIKYGKQRRHPRHQRPHLFLPHLLLRPRTSHKPQRSLPRHKTRFPPHERSIPRFQRRSRVDC